MLYVGIDIGKRAHEAVVLADDGSPLGKSFKIANSHDGLKELLGRVARLNTKQEAVRYGLEATGHYWLALYSHLLERGQEVTVFNPLQTSAYRRLGIRPVKNDPGDATCIAALLRLEPAVTERQAQDSLLGLRELTRLRAALVDQVADQKRRLLAVLDLVFPEFDSLFSDVFGSAATALLERCPTPEEVAALDLEWLSQLLAQSSRGRLGREKAQQVQEAAKCSFGARLALDASVLHLRLLLEQIHFLEGQLLELGAAIAEHLSRLPQYLTSVPGVGPTIAATILAEVGDVRRFKGASALVAYAGIDPGVFQTGQYEAKSMRMSKRGSPHLRRALWQAALLATWHDSQMKELYQRKVAAGKHHSVAVGAVANKLTHIIYAVLRDCRPYVAVPPVARENPAGNAAA